jgi:hypothetical protein
MECEVSKRANEKKVFASVVMKWLLAFKIEGAEYMSKIK